MSSFDWVPTKSLRPGDIAYNYYHDGPVLLLKKVKLFTLPKTSGRNTIWSVYVLSHQCILDLKFDDLTTLRLKPPPP